MLKMIAQGLDCLFLKHPREAGERYFEHLAFTVRISLQLWLIGAALLIHGLVPHLFPRTASTRMRCLFNAMQERIAQAEQHACKHKPDGGHS